MTVKTSICNAKAIEKCMMQCVAATKNTCITRTGKQQVTASTYITDNYSTQFRKIDTAVVAFYILCYKSNYTKIVFYDGFLLNMGVGRTDMSVTKVRENDLLFSH
jgi:hypothetical protein